MERLIKTGLLALAIAAISGFLFWDSSRAKEPLACRSDADCAIKEGDCGQVCVHKSEEVERNPDVRCDYRPWFKQERCKCRKDRCTQVTCEELGLDYTECGR